MIIFIQLPIFANFLMDFLELINLSNTTVSLFIIYFENIFSADSIIKASEKQIFFF